MWIERLKSAWSILAVWLIAWAVAILRLLVASSQQSLNMFELSLVTLAVIGATCVTWWLIYDLHSFGKDTPQKLKKLKRLYREIGFICTVILIIAIPYALSA